MRNALLVLSLAVTVSVVRAGDVKLFAGARFDEKTWAKVQTFQVKNLAQNIETHVGKLVEIHFQFRSKDIRHLKPNWHQSEVWQTAPEQKRGFVSVPVMIAAGDVSAFKQITTDSRDKADAKAYGQVLYDF